VYDGKSVPKHRLDQRKVNGKNADPDFYVKWIPVHPTFVLNNRGAVRRHWEPVQRNPSSKALT